MSLRLARWLRPGQFNYPILFAIPSYPILSYPPSAEHELGHHSRPRRPGRRRLYSEGMRHDQRNHPKVSGCEGLGTGEAVPHADHAYGAQLGRGVDAPPLLWRGSCVLPFAGPHGPPPAAARLRLTAPNPCATLLVCGAARDADGARCLSPLRVSLPRAQNVWG